MRHTKKEVDALVDRINAKTGDSLIFTHRYDYYAIDRVYPSTGSDAIKTGLTVRDAYNMLSFAAALIGA